ncbi:MAG: peroxiredoxin-like family protein [Pseudomonadales bacterium]
MKNFIRTFALPVTLLVTLFSVSANVAAATPASKTNDPLKIAEPREYKPTATDKLGVNENNKGLKVGERAEELTINDMHGKPYPIKNAWQENPALIVFYRGGWCPFCNMQVRELATNYDKLKAAGVQPLLISVDEPEKSAMVSAEYDIPFPVLSDPNLIAHNAFNVVLELDDATLEKYKEYGINLQDWSGKGHNSIAVASAFLIDTSGHVVVSHAPEDYTSRPSVEQLLALIEKMGP